MEIAIVGVGIAAVAYYEWAKKKKNEEGDGDDSGGDQNYTPPLPPVVVSKPLGLQPSAIKSAPQAVTPPKSLPPPIDLKPAGPSAPLSGMPTGWLCVFRGDCNKPIGV